MTQNADSTRLKSPKIGSCDVDNITWKLVRQPRQRFLSTDYRVGVPPVVLVLHCLRAPATRSFPQRRPPGDTALARPFTSRRFVERFGRCWTEYEQRNKIRFGHFTKREYFTYLPRRHWGGKRAGSERPLRLRGPESASSQAHGRWWCRAVRVPFGCAPFAPRSLPTKDVVWTTTFPHLHNY